MEHLDLRVSRLRGQLLRVRDVPERDCVRERDGSARGSVVDLDIEQRWRHSDAATRCRRSSTDMVTPVALIAFPRTGELVAIRVSVSTSRVGVVLLSAGAGGRSTRVWATTRRGDSTTYASAPRRPTTKNAATSRHRLEIERHDARVSDGRSCFTAMFGFPWVSSRCGLPSVIPRHGLFYAALLRESRANRAADTRIRVTFGSARRWCAEPPFLAARIIRERPDSLSKQAWVAGQRGAQNVDERRVVATSRQRAERGSVRR